MGFYKDDEGVLRLWLYWVSFVVVELLLWFFSFRLFFFGWNVAQRFFGVFLAFIALFGFVFLFFGFVDCGSVVDCGVVGSSGFCVCMREAFPDDLLVQGYTECME
ncbi:hypothetical protein JW865_04690 [Candidatus Bathyarchaeota archaeon]|nr:hypothetical protein [Candidatus Bathyarchaeota archaeon]